jgi:translation initiation factor IF-2
MEEKAEEVYDKIEQQREEERSTYVQNRRALFAKGYIGSTTRQIVHKKQRFVRDDLKTADGPPALRLILRSDVDGTLEAILNVIDTYNSEQVDFQLVDFDVGPPTEKNIEIAEETGAIMYCFNVPISAGIRQMAIQKGITVEQFNVIYRLVDALKTALSEKLPPEIELHQVGEGHVEREYLLSDSGRKRLPVAGTQIDWGIFKKTCTFRILRGTEVVYEGPIESMKRENDFVTSSSANTGVGLALDRKDIRFKKDDTIEAFDEIVKKRTIDWDPPGF